MARAKLITDHNYIKAGKSYCLNQAYHYNKQQLDKLIATYETALEDFTSAVAFRVDLSIREDARATYQPDDKVIAKFIDALKKRKYTVNHKDNTTSTRRYPFHYAWKRESGDSKGVHYHLMLFYNLRDINNVFIDKSKVYCAIKAIWNNLNSGKGVTQLITHQESSAEQIKYEYVARPKQKGSITHYLDHLFHESSVNKKRLDPWITIRNDTTNRMGFFHWYCYLAKHTRAGNTEQVQKTASLRNFGTGKKKLK